MINVDLLVDNIIKTEPRKSFEFNLESIERYSKDSMVKGEPVLELNLIATIIELPYSWAVAINDVDGIDAFNFIFSWNTWESDGYNMESLKNGLNELFKDDLAY